MHLRADLTVPAADPRDNLLVGFTTLCVGAGSPPRSGALFAPAAVTATLLGGAVWMATTRYRSRCARTRLLRAIYRRDAALRAAIFAAHRHVRKRHHLGRRNCPRIRTCPCYWGAASLISWSSTSEFRLDRVQEAGHISLEKGPLLCRRCTVEARIVLPSAARSHLR